MNKKEESHHSYSPLNKFFKQSNKKTKLLISLSILGLLLFIALATLVPFKDTLFSSLYPKGRSFAASLSTVDILTNQLRQTEGEYEKAKVGVSAQAAQQKLTSLVSIASQRKQELLKELETNPQAFLNHAILAEEKNKYPKEVQQALQGQIEERKQVSGSLMVIYTDDLEHKKAKLIYSVIDGQNAYKLYFAQNEPKLNSGSKVIVKGIAIDSKIALQSGTSQYMIISNGDLVRPEGIEPPTK